MDHNTRPERRKLEQPVGKHQHESQRLLCERVDVIGNALVRVVYIRFEKKPIVPAVLEIAG